MWFLVPWRQVWNLLISHGYREGAQIQASHLPEDNLVQRRSGGLVAPLGEGWWILYIKLSGSVRCGTRYGARTFKMALPLDAVDLLCGRSNLPADVGVRDFHYRIWCGSTRIGETDNRVKSWKLFAFYDDKKATIKNTDFKKPGLPTSVSCASHPIGYPWG